MTQGRRLLSALLSAALALSMVPTGAIQAFAEEVEAVSEELVDAAAEEPASEKPSVEAPVVDESAAAEPATEDPVPEEPVIEEVAAEEPAVPSASSPTTRGLLRAPSGQGMSTEVAYNESDAQDGVLKSLTLDIIVKPTDSSVTITDSPVTKPKLVLTYRDDEGKDHDVTFDQVGIWQAAGDGSFETIASPSVSEYAHFYTGTLSGIETSAGSAEVSFDLDHTVVPELCTAKILLLTKDSDGTYHYIMDKDDSTKCYDLIDALATATVDSPVVKEASAIEVQVNGACDVDGSTCQAVLVDAEGKEVATAPLSRTSAGIYRALFKHQGDHAGADSTGADLPEGPLGVKVVASDRFGEQLKTDDAHRYVLYGAATVTQEDATETVKASGTFLLDTGAPTATYNYPHGDAVVDTHISPTAGMVVMDRPAETSKTDFFTSSITCTATIYEANLDLTASTFGGVTLKDIVDAGTDGVWVDTNKALYKATSSGTSTLKITAEYHNGTHEMPQLHVVDRIGSSADYDLGVGNIYGSTYEIDHIVVDSYWPIVKAARINSDPVATIDASANHVLFYKSDSDVFLTLEVEEESGIHTIELVDESGRYQLLGDSVKSAAEAGNEGMLASDHSGKYNFQIVSKLAEGNDFSDGVASTFEGLAIKFTDFAGNAYTWSLAEKDFGKSAYASVGSEGIAAELQFGSTSLGHPTLMVLDNTAPAVTLPDVTGAGSVEGYDRYYASGQSTTLTVVERNLRWLHGFEGGDSVFDAFGDVEGAFGGLEPGRTVAVVKYTSPEGTVSTETVTVADLAAGSDGETYTKVLDFSADGTYEVTATLTDVVGLSATASIAEFVVDATAPVITVDWNPADSAAVNGGYFSSTRTVDITVAERNFDPKLFSITATASATPSSYVPFVYDPSKWVDQGDGTHVYTVSFLSDGTYSIGVEGKDKAGNDAEYEGDSTGYATDNFVIDTDDPLIYEAELETTSHTYDGVNYYTHPINVDAKVRDRNFTAIDTTLAVSKDEVETVQAVTWERTPDERDSEGYEYWLTSMAYAEDGAYLSPHVIAADLAGRTTDNKSALKPFVVDLKAPTIAVAVDQNPVSQGSSGSSDPYNFYNVVTTMTFTVSDEHLLRSVAVDDPDGLYSVSTSDTSAEGKGSVTVTLSLQDGTLANDGEYQRDIVLTAEDLAGNQRTWTIDHTGTVVLDEVSKDEANVGINDGTEHPYTLVQDTVAPVVGLSGATAGTYYNTPQTVVASVTEYHMEYLQMFAGERVIVTVTAYAANAGRSASTHTIPASVFGGTRPDYSYSEVFSSDGHYVVTASFKDFAENQSNEASIGEFTIDMTPPTISLEFDNNDARNGMYYKDTRTATITVQEHNFDSSLINIETGGIINGWVDNGDTHTCTVFFGEGGPYTLKVSGKDLAGNDGGEVSEPEFIVDLTAPEITIAGTAQRLGYLGDDASGGLINAYHGTLEDQNAYNGVVVPTITYTDNEDLSTEDLGHALAGSKHGEGVEHGASLSGEGKEMVVTLADLGYVGPGYGDGSNWDDFYVDDYAVDADDIYVLSASMTDQAGNEAEAEITFSVNRYGSNYEVWMQGLDAEEQAQYEASGMLSEAPTIKVREVNVSGVADRDAAGNVYGDNHHVVKEFANATTAIDMQVGNGAGYALEIVDAPQATNGWSEYVYTVRAANFGEGSDSDHDDRGQGVYRVNVMSDDTSSNANTTAEYWRSDDARAQAEASYATAEFVLDELGPAIDDLDLPESLKAGEEYQASFHVTDDITSGDVIEVVVDGVTLDASEVQGPSNGVGTFTFTIPAKAFNWHRTVSITVRDYAGREDTLGNHTWFWLSSFVPEGMTVAGAVAAGVAGAVLYRKRKLAAEPELPE